MTDIATALANHGIKLRSHAPGDHKTLCPWCSHTRKNKRDLCLSVTLKADGRIAIDLAVADGDRSSSTGKLKRLIDAGLTRDTQHERRVDPRPSADGTLRSADVY